MRSRLVSVHGREPGLAAEREPRASPSLPEGVVTFALADVEGSSRLWERDAESMRVAISRHDELVERCVAETGGVRPLEQGEGVVAAFSHASRALAFALSLQRSLASAEWPEGFELRVRIALHSGEALLRGDANYVGPTLNRCARLRELAHGGQTLVSRATHELIARRLPEGASLNSLGTLRLRGVGVEKEAFELSHPELPSGFPPPRALEGLSNLPTELSSFVGRERELRELAALLGSERLITLTGAGGCGKTRLALEACFERHQRYPDGTWWAELAPLSAPELVGAEIAAALGVRPLPGRTPLEAACAYLASRRALVVLDNCEHLAAASAEAAKALVDSGPGVSVLATSRAPLGVSGETDWRVPSLTLPEPGTGGSSAELSGADAVKLFCERAREARPRFELSSENADAVAAICAELDGLPLALELAAARLRVLSARDIATALSDRFRILAGGPQTATPRHKTLRASVEWSHDLLSAPERALLRRLSVFAGTFSLAAAEEVCAGEGIEAEAIEPAGILDLIAALVDHSLLIAAESGQAVRFRALETVRQYGAERLEEAGEAEAIRNRHRDFFLALAEEVAPKLETAAQREGLEVLDPEAANVAVALDRALETEPALALRFCIACYRWWSARGRVVEAEHGYSRALEVAGETETGLRAQVLLARARNAIWLGELLASVTHVTEAIALAAEVGDQATEARARGAVGSTMLPVNPRGARAEAERAAALARSAGDDWALCHVKRVIAGSYAHQLDLNEVARANEDGFAETERIGDPYQLGWYWLFVAIPALFAGRFGDLRDAVERQRAVLEGGAEPWMSAWGEATLAAAEAWEGDFERGRERLETELESVLNLGMVHFWTTAWLAFVELACGRLEQARDRLEAALARMARTPMGASMYASLGRGVLAEAHRLIGDDDAEDEALRAQEVGEQIGSRFLATSPRFTLGRLAAARGEWSPAREHALAHLDTCVEGGFATYVPGCLDALAEVAAGVGAEEDAVRLFAAAEHAREEIGIVRVPPERDHWDAIDARLRDSLGEKDHEAARAQGAELTSADALEWARRGRGSRQRPAAGWDSLTPTELRVAELVAEGLTNPEIAERMFVSRGTVKTHMAHIFRKLEVRSRTELGAEAARRRSRA